MPKGRRTQTVLVIEDETDIRNFISRVLELEGYCTLKAGDGETGLKIVQENAIDLVILDIRLPGMNGWSVLRGLKQTPTLSDVPVIILTAIAEIAQRDRALKMGADLYLIKPLSAHLLSLSIASVLGNKSAGLQMLEEKAAV